KNFVTLARSTGNNAEAHIYVYEGWPHHVEMPSWLFPFSGTTSLARKDYFETLANTLSSDLDEQVLVIPTGDVIYRMKLAIEAGQFPHWPTLSALYRDALHMGAPGQFLASTTVATTLTKQNPVGLFNPNPWYPDANNQTEAMALQRIVWDV